MPVSTPGVVSGQEVTLGLRPHDIVLAGGGASRATHFAAKIHLTEPLGDMTIIDVDAQGTMLKMVLREEIAARYSVGQDIDIGFDPEDLHLFDRRTGMRIDAAPSG